RESDFARVRQLRLHRLTQLRDMPGAVADRAFLKLLYGSHPYGHSPIGNEAALAAMDVDDVRAFHTRSIRPSVATLIAVGDGARTAFEFRRLPGPFVLQVSVQTSGTARAVEESIGEIAGIRGSRPVTADELALGIAALTRGYARSFETGEQIGRAAIQLALYDLPDDYFEQFVPRVERVTSDEVSRVMERHLDPPRLVTLIVGDLDVIGQDLNGLGHGAPVVLSPDAF